MTRNRVAHTSLLFTLTAGAFLAGFATPADSQVLLRKPELFAPEEIAGLDLQPEVKVRVALDERGTVSGVEILNIVPSTEHDDVLAEHTRLAVQEWRFAPAKTGGVPTATTLEWTVRYVPTRQREVDLGELDKRRLTQSLTEDPGVVETRLRSLAPDKRWERIQQYAASAERQLDKTNRRQARSPRFLVITDSTDERTAEILAGNLEAAFNLFDEVFRPDLEPYPEENVLVTYLFAKRHALDTVSRAFQFGSGMAGFYRAPGFLALHQETTPEAILHTMVHEAFHAYTDRHLSAPGHRISSWLSEGLAEYFGNSQIQKGKLVPGKTLRRKFALHYGQVFKVTTRAGFTLSDLKKAVRTGEAPGLSGLSEMAYQQFHGEEQSMHYGLSWLWMHFLRHGSQQWATAAFPEFLRYAFEGYPLAASLQQAYGRTLAELDQEFTAYVRGF